MKTDSPHILLVNPWIHDFAAYDVWAKPYGLLSLAAIIRHHGFPISYIDCQNRFHPKDSTKDPFLRNGRGPYHKKVIEKPEGLTDINRQYCRYGIEPEWFREDLLSLPRPDLVLVTSMMTYWAPGVAETISVIKNTLKDVPVILGGIYATLCHEHAQKYSGADSVIAGYVENKILDIIYEHTGTKTELKYNPSDINTYPYPAFDLQNVINYVPILTARGCPYSCAYCASKILHPGVLYRSPDHVVKEIEYWSTIHQVKDFSFYDDALLINGEKHAYIILEQVIRKNLNIRFHTPNALHIREITEKAADLMFRAGFKTLRLGLETVDFDKRTQDLDRKVTEREFYKAVNNLLAAGFQKEQIGAYILTGLPFQQVESVEHAITICLNIGITPVMAHYTPIPHTSLWEKAVSSSRYDLEKDPVFTNNAVSPCQKEPFSWDKISHLKKMIQNWKR